MIPKYLITGIFLIFSYCTLASATSSINSIDISGQWNSSNNGIVYDLEQFANSNLFTWQVYTPFSEQGEGSINSKDVYAEWERDDSSNGSASGKIVSVDEQSKATRIEWSNGVVFFRSDGKVAPPLGAEYMIKDYAICKDVVEKEPVDRTDTFSADAARVYQWINIVPHYRSHTVEYKWYSPDGGLFYKNQSTSEDKRYEEGWKYWGWIAVKGHEAENLPGLWKVDTYIDGQHVLSQQFVITLASDQSAILVDSQDQGFMSDFPRGEPIKPFSIWKIKEYGPMGNWDGEWIIRGDAQTIDASWSGGSITDIIEIKSIRGDQITLYRHGNKGYYTGTISPDGLSMSGTASWYSPGEKWVAIFASERGI